MEVMGLLRGHLWYLFSDRIRMENLDLVRKMKFNTLGDTQERSLPA